MIWLVRMSRWARRPPSWKTVKFVLAVIAICAILYGIDLVFGWPEALTPNRLPRRGTF